MIIELILLLIIGGLILWIVKLKTDKNENNFKQKFQYTPPSTEEFSLELDKSAGVAENVRLDSLTKLPGREAFEDRLSQAVTQSKRFEKSFAVMYLDIDDFHLINESQGYPVGDKILIEVANRLKGVIRQIDTITRFGGDRFVVLLPQLSLPETAAYAAQRLLDNMVVPYNIDGKDYLLTASIGVAIFPVDGQNAQMLLRNADDALHQIKVSHKGRYKFYHHEMHALGERELRMNAVLSKTDFLNNIIINYQPIVNVKTRETVALVASPLLKLGNFELIAFVDFAKTAENCGKTLEIGEWLLRSSVMQFARWRKEGFRPSHLQVNLTYHQIQNSKFIYKVAQILKELNVNPNEVVFEISASDLTKIDQMVYSFALLNKIEVQTCLSILALGHLALHKITQLPIRYLKIDSKLCQGKSLEEHESILHVVMALAQEMKISVIAEGVDTEIQKAFLENLGCELMQGKVFGEPLPV